MCAADIENGRCCGKRRRRDQPVAVRLRNKATESDSANAASCVDTSGPNIKVGALNSLSGTMAISEVTVRWATKAQARPLCCARPSGC